MDVLATVINAAVVAVVGLVLGWLGKGRFDSISHRFDAQDGAWTGLSRGWTAEWTLFRPRWNRYDPSSISR